MKTKRMFLVAVLAAYTATLSAQVARTQADTIVKAYLQSENADCSSLYVHIDAPDAEGVDITTSNDEAFKAKYACWAYYLNESELSQCRYLFVKADDGNLLEVVAVGDLGQSDLTQWEKVDEVGISNYELGIMNYLVYPNPTTRKLTIRNEKSGMSSEIEIFDVVGRKLLSHSPLTSDSSPLIEIDISHLSAGLYFLKVDGKTVKVVKQ
ncbi:MAG: T9SS type A sorting domain-containing protein [Lentimicrobiaceae bacterium]|nr:T9SS type A sorting domain-containing protein [Lentimicrobiaceae bacterium]